MIFSGRTIRSKTFFREKVSWKNKRKQTYLNLFGKLQYFANKLATPYLGLKGTLFGRSKNCFGIIELQTKVKSAIVSCSIFVMDYKFQ